jgi:hypothetical protein
MVCIAIHIHVVLLIAAPCLFMLLLLLLLVVLGLAVLVGRPHACMCWEDAALRALKLTGRFRVQQLPHIGADSSPLSHRTQVDQGAILVVECCHLLPH